MNSKKARELRRISKQVFIQGENPSKAVYRDLKDLYKKGTIKINSNASDK